jgi:1A family penicillin-binding protein
VAVRKRYRAVSNKQSETSLNRLKKSRSVNFGTPSFLQRKNKIYHKKQGIKWIFVGFFAWIFSLFTRGQKAGKRKSNSLAHRLLPFFAKFAVISAIAGFFLTAGVFIYFSKDIPDPSKISDRSVDQSTKIFDRTGNTLLYEIHGDEKRTIVKLDQISPYLMKAAVATEDKRFYSHIGIDFKGIARSIYKDVISGEKAQGGSTITQQLIKNSILTSEKKYTRKIKEIILALETEQKFSKDEIMEMYLNQIPYGSNLYGAEVASQTFFGKPAKDLDIAEAAMLAAIPQATTRYFPYGSHPDELEARRKFVIGQMLEDGYITEQEANDAKNVDMSTRLKPFTTDIKAPHFVMYIKQQLVDQYGEDVVEKGGLKVYTTLDYDMQLIAEDAVKVGVEYNTKNYDAHNAALVAVDPKTGQILSMVGSKDYFNLEEDGNVNVAISENRQPGSSFKPFVYATAFKKGYTPDTILFDVPTNFGADGSGKNFEPKNYNLQYSGPVTIRSALGRSLNVPAVKALYLAGIEDSLQTAHDLGITTLNDGNYGLSLVLGTGGTRLLDMTGAYSVFANDGKRNDVTGILKVEDANGAVLQEYKENPKQVLDEQVARNITSILSDNVARTPTFGARSKLYFPDRPVAAKTGTTSDYKDAWTIGYTPSLAAGVWAGNNSGKEMTRGGGVSAATPIWNDFLTRVLKDKEVERFTAPVPISTNKAVLNGQSKNEKVVTIDKACGDKLAGENTPEDQKEQKTFYEVHNILYYVDKNNPQGDYPQKPQEDPQFANWEAGVLEWAKVNMTDVNNQVVPTEICDVRSESNAPTIKVISPSDNQIIKDGRIDIEAKAYSFYGIKQVEFYFDGDLLKINQEEPYKGTFRLAGDIEDGLHIVKIKAYDKIDNVSEKSISIIIGGSDANIYLKPISGTDFPLALESVVAINSDDISKVEFYYQLDSVYDSDMNLIKKPGTEYKIGESSYVAPGSSNLYQILWEEDKQYFISGKYKLYSTVTTEKNKKYSSNIRYVEIK